MLINVMTHQLLWWCGKKLKRRERIQVSSRWNEAGTVTQALVRGWNCTGAHRVSSADPVRRQADQAFLVLDRVRRNTSDHIITWNTWSQQHVTNKCYVQSMKPWIQTMHWGSLFHSSEHTSWDDVASLETAQWNVALGIALCLFLHATW